MDKQRQHSDLVVSELAGDADMVELVELFVSELPMRMAAMCEAMDRDDLQTLTRLAHQLKGSAGGYGFPAITHAAMGLEETAKATSDVEQLAKQVSELAELCAKARATPTVV